MSSNGTILRFETDVMEIKATRGTQPSVYRIILKEVREKIAEASTNENAELIADTLNAVILNRENN